MSVPRPSVRSASWRAALSTAAALAVACGMVIALPGQASAAEISCIVNSVAVSGSTISGTSGDDTIRCYEGVARGVSIEAGAGNDSIFVEGEPASGTLGGNGQIGNDGTIDGGPGDDNIFVRGGSGDSGALTHHGGKGGDGNNRTIIGGGGIDTITVLGGGGGEGGMRRGDGGAGGIGNDGNITAQGTV
ncbi:hypothetical protein ACFWNE_06450, partial [Streptomyces goshikiensis]